MKQLLTSVMLCLSTMLFAQPFADPNWETDLGAEVQWQKVALTGQLLVQSTSGLHLVDPESGTVRWTNSSLSESEPNSLHEIAATPFVRLSTGTNTLVISLIDGKTVMNAADLGVDEILKERYLPTHNALAIAGKTGKAYGLWLIDLHLPKLKWKKTDFDAPVFGMHSTGSNSLLIATPLKLFAFDLNSGSMLWDRYIDQETEQQMALLGSFGNTLLEMIGAFDMSGVKLNFIDLGDDRYALGYQSKSEEEEKAPDGTVRTKVSFKSGYSFFRLSSGEPIAEDIHTNGIRGVLLRGADGVIISYRGSWGPRINKLDLESGKMLWGKKGKGNKIKGHVSEAYPTQHGILLSMTKDDIPNEKSNYYFNILDPGTGEMLFDDDLKVNERVRSMQMVEAGALVITEEEVFLIDLDEQDFRWDDPVEETSPALTARSGNRFYAFSNDDGLLFEIDLSSGAKRTLSKEELEFDEREDPQLLEVREDGLFLSSDQNIALIDLQGNLVYHKVYEAPRLPALVRILAAANAMRAAYIGASAYAAAATIEGAQQEYSNELNEFENVLLEGTKEVYSEIGEAGMSAAGEQFAKVTARFKATQSGQDHMYMLGQGEEDEHFLLRIAKANGKVEMRIPLGSDSSPVYGVDPIEDRVFYRPAGSTILGYSFE